MQSAVATTEPTTTPGPPKRSVGRIDRNRFTTINGQRRCEGVTNRPPSKTEMDTATLYRLAHGAKLQSGSGEDSLRAPSRPG